MISVEKFVNVIHEQLLDPLLITSFGFSPRYSTDPKNFSSAFLHTKSSSGMGQMNGRCIWWHEEPLNYTDLDGIRYQDVYMPEMEMLCYRSAEYTVAPGPPSQPGMLAQAYTVNFHVFANSEKSTLKKQFLKDWQVYDWYFFFHGFAALNWFNDYKYLNFSNYNLSKVFICLNYLITNNRSYRLNLLSHLRQAKLEPYGFVSAPLLNKDIIKQELFDTNTKLSVPAKKHILNHLATTAAPIVLDVCNYKSASADVIDPKFQVESLWSVVTETVFYEDKLHLTEKIFKPIVTRRPFILVGGFGNLAYLKSYGFKTFDRWIDESYDNEQDPDIRIKLITDQLKILCSMPWTDLLKMHEEMQETLEFNHHHFYNKFKEIIVNELVDNFEVCTKQYNMGLSNRFKLPTKYINFESVKKLLLK